MSATASSSQPARATRGFAPGSRIGWIFAAVWLVYLIEPLKILIANAQGWRQVVGLAGFVAFVTLFMVGIQKGRGLRLKRRFWPTWQRWGHLIALAIALAAMAPGAGDSMLTGGAFLAAFAAASLDFRPAIVTVAVVLVLTEVSSRIVEGWADHGYGFGVVLAAVAAGSFRLAFDRHQALMLAQQELSELAIEEERARIARDLHDILGHSLTVITVKTELAQRLLDVDIERARAELADLEALSRDALADVRATALGVRGVSLSSEIAQARSALEAAGIEAELPTVADEVPSRWREVFAWTIRECVTNVIRHSQARHCTIELSPRSLLIRDDGIGMMTNGPAAGQGLVGLRKRVEQAGAALSMQPGPGGCGLDITVEVP